MVKRWRRDCCIPPIKPYKRCYKEFKGVIKVTTVKYIPIVKTYKYPIKKCVEIPCGYYPKKPSKPYIPR